MQITKKIKIDDEAVQTVEQQDVLPESRYDLRTVESRALLGKDFVMFEMKIQIAPVYILHHEAKTLVGTERILE